MDISYLDKYFDGTIAIASTSLKKKLFKYNIKERKCERCNNVNWEGDPMPLQLHHIDGNNQNNNLINLQILCPNCHALTPNFGTKNRMRQNFEFLKIKKGRHLSLEEKRFLDELRAKDREIANWDTNEELIKLIWEKPCLIIAKEYGISSNAIKHRCKRRNIPTPPPGYWRKFECGKLEECAEIKRNLFIKAGLVTV